MIAGQIRQWELLELPEPFSQFAEADRRDTDRARRNARFLTRCTGQPALPFVASVGNDREVAELVDAGTVGWFQLDEREFEAD